MPEGQLKTLTEDDPRGRDLLHSTSLNEQKFNLFLFTPRTAKDE